MASSPRWKVYSAQGEYVAAVKEVEAAAVLMGFYGDGATIRNGHHFVVWTEGAESCSALDSYDAVAEIANMRLSTYEMSRKKEKQ